MRLIRIALLCSAFSATAAHAAPAGWTISEASPGVLVLHGGMTKAALRGGRVEAGDVVSTAQNARAVLVNGEQYAVVAPNTRLQIANPQESGGLMQFIEKIGNVVFSVKKGTAPHFGVQTPYLAAVVKGTTFSVTVDDGGASVQVVEGAVEVATLDGGAHHLVEPGNIAVVGAADLGQLTVQGKTTEVLRSPGSAANMPQPASSKAGALTPAVVTEAGGEPDASPNAPQTSHRESTPVVIAEAVEESPRSIGALSDGLVSGTTGVNVALAAVTPSPAETRLAVLASSGGGSGNATSGGNGNSASSAGGNGDGSSNAAGNGTGNSGSGNSGSGSDNGVGNGGSDNGNGHGGSGNSGSGSDNGVGNGGSNNGNGHGGSGNSGSGNGNGNGGSNNGNGHGGSGNSGSGSDNGVGNGGSNNGNGNGSGNSGSNGNGNGNSGSGNSGSGNGNGNGGSNSGNGNGSGNSGGNGNSGSGSGHGNGGHP